MKKIAFLTMAFLIGFGTVGVRAQFTIKIPKIGKPKTEQPKPQQPTTAPPNEDGDSTPAPRAASAHQNSALKSKDAVDFMPQPRPSGAPVLLKDSLEIKIKTENHYWKAPNQQFYTSWIPLIRFDLFYDNSETVRYTVEWLNPDGSPWFSEALDGTQTRYSGEVFDAKATVAVGTFGVRLLNSKTKEVVFQGKFKVGKIPLSPGEPRYKNMAMFYAENDWSLPVGYVGFNENTSWDYDPHPSVYMWFKGDLKAEDFEARLFYNNQQITSTDDGGTIVQGGLGAEQRNNDNCFQNAEVCRYFLWEFTWKNFRVESYDKVEHKYSQGYARAEPNAIYTKDKPGEYAVKIFHKGVQVREAKFTVQPNGWLAPNPFANQLPMKNYRAVIPVKIMGNLDKWNPAAWKTDAFYGNPLAGFAAP